MIIELNKQGHEKALRWLMENVKDTDAVRINQEEWLLCVADSVTDRIPGSHEPDYELPAHLSKDGTPKLLSFTNDDFDFFTEEEEEDKYCSSCSGIGHQHPDHGLCLCCGGSGRE